MSRASQRKSVGDRLFNYIGHQGGKTLVRCAQIAPQPQKTGKPPELKQFAAPQDRGASVA
jgi:hypothetical protein